MVCQPSPPFLTVDYAAAPDQGKAKQVEAQAKTDDIHDPAVGSGDGCTAELGCSPTSDCPHWRKQFREAADCQPGSLLILDY